MHLLGEFPQEVSFKMSPLFFFGGGGGGLGLGREDRAGGPTIASFHTVTSSSSLHFVLSWKRIPVFFPIPFTVT